MENTFKLNLTQKNIKRYASFLTIAFILTVVLFHNIFASASQFASNKATGSNENLTGYDSSLKIHRMAREIAHGAMNEIMSVIIPDKEEPSAYAQIYQMVISFRINGDTTVGRLLSSDPTGRHSGTDIYRKTESSTLHTQKNGEDITVFEDFFKGIISMAKYIALLWMIALAIMNYMEAQQREQASSDLFYKMATQVAVTGMIIIKSDMILEMILIFGNWLAAFVCKSLINFKDPEATGVSWADLVRDARGDGQLKGGSIFTQAPAWASLVLPWGAVKLVEIASKFVILQLIFELAIRRVLLPFAITDIYHEGLRSRGAMWFKGIFGVFMKILTCAIVAALIAMFSDIIMEFSTKGMDNAEAMDGKVFAVILMSFTGLGLMLKSGEYINKLLGIN
jgi:hypothetical protein